MSQPAFVPANRLALDYLTDKYHLTLKDSKPCVEIPNVGRDNLPEIFHDLNFKVGAEIGVEQGLYAEVLCQRNPGVHLHCVDAWEPYMGYREHVSQPKLETFFTRAQQRLAPYHVTFIRKMSVDAAKDFEPKSLDFIYIDANHDLRHVIADLDAWIPKVKHGGIVAGHDFMQRSDQGRYQCHVVEAVSAWTSAYSVRPWFILGQKAEIPGEIRDRPRSWMWVVP
jgi:hypothetical protein